MHATDARNITPITAEPLQIRDLEYIGFSGQNGIAHGLFRSLSREHWNRHTSRHVLSAVIAGGIAKLRKYLAASAEKAAADEKLFIDAVVRHFVQSCTANQSRPRELFESLLLWSEELTRLSLFPEALSLHDDLLTLGVSRYPDVHVRTLLGKATVLGTMGRLHQAESLLASLAERPYVVPDRNLIPDIMFSLSRTLLLRGHAEEYRRLLFAGLRFFYTNLDTRRLFIDQLRTTYRRSYRLVLDPHVALSDKVLYVLHWVMFKAQGFRLLHLVHLPRLLRLALLGYVYSINYVHRATPRAVAFRQEGRRGYGAAPEDEQQAGVTPSRSATQRVLVTRAMGGIGDLLMMTPGFHALKRKDPGREIHLAIPRRYFPLFQGNPDVAVLDVEQPIDWASYTSWFNLTDCPAARVESRTAPRVKKTRTEIFARAVGVSGLGMLFMDKRPRYTVTEDELEFRTSFWGRHGLEGKEVLGVQLRSDETYRDYPHMERLVRALSRERPVLVFDAEAIEGCSGPNIIKVAGLPMRQAFALASACAAIVAPDSAFVHLAAALDVPCVALYGPIDGAVRTKHYPRCTFLDVRQRLQCLPCWRNEQIACRLTNMRSSVCMAEISIHEITSAVNEVLRGRTIA